MSVPDRDIEDPRGEVTWCYLCGQMSCDCFHDYYVQQDHDEPYDERESNP
jgi:hypothetical protein